VIILDISIHEQSKLLTSSQDIRHSDNELRSEKRASLGNRGAVNSLEVGSEACGDGKPGEQEWSEAVLRERSVIAKLV
jgi:hypothetical protein